MARKKEIDLLMDKMKLYRNHEIYTKASNPELFEIKQKKNQKRDHFVDIQEEIELQKLQRIYARRAWNVKDE